MGICSGSGILQTLDIRGVMNTGTLYAIHYKLGGHVLKIPTKHIEFTVTLPICLHLDEREFLIDYKKDSKIKIENRIIFNKEETFLGMAINMEVLSDSFSHFRFTELLITIPNFDEHPIEESEITIKFEKPFFMAVNKFIDAARLALKRYGIKNYYSYSDFYGAVRVKTSESLLIIDTMPGEGLSTLHPFRTTEEHIQVQELLSNGSQLFEVFLAESKKELYHFNILHAHLNAVIALEIKVSETIRIIGKAKGIEDSAINEFIKGVGLTGNIKTTLRLITRENTVYPVDEIFENCKAAITIRNKIMHAGKRDLSLSEVEKSLKSIEIMIDFCKQVLNSV